MVRLSLSSVLLTIVSVIISFGQTTAQSSTPVIFPVHPEPKEEGSSIELVCSVMYDLGQTLEWFKYTDSWDRELIEDTDRTAVTFYADPIDKGDKYYQTLAITNIQASDAGTYICVGSNDKYGVEERTVTLRVLPKSEEPAVGRYLSTTSSVDTSCVLPQPQPDPQQEGHTIELQCGVNRRRMNLSDTVLIRWSTTMRGGRWVEIDNPRGRISVSTINDEHQYTKILTITEINRSDAKYYQCDIRTPNFQYMNRLTLEVNTAYSPFHNQKREIEKIDATVEIPVLEF